jgi:hypothetical protein
MMDNSGSMTTVDRGQAQSRWELISTAVPAFLAAPGNAGLWAGLDFFPEFLAGGADAGRGGGGNNASCNPVDYENPNVPFALVPGAANAQVNAFATAIGTRNVQGNTPTTPALQGAIVSAAAWQASHLDQIVSVVFVTDGQPNGCNSSVANAAAAAAAGLARTPPIRTYVLGVGPQVGNLDAIAQGGGSGSAYIVTTGGAAALTTALNTIKGTAVTCDYAVPTVPNRQLDFAQVNVQTRLGSNGNPVILPQVSGAASCGTGIGWYYDTPVVAGGPPPSTITLCPQACEPLKLAPGSEVQVLIGCKTVVRIL